MSFFSPKAWRDMKKKGLKEIEDPKGTKFDTNFHEAMTNVPAPTKKEKGKIIGWLRKYQIING